MGRSCNKSKDFVKGYYNAENVSSAPSERQSRQACEKVKTTTLDRVRCSSVEMSSCTRREKSDREEMRGSCYDHQNDVFLTCAAGCSAGEFKNTNGTMG